MKIAFKGEGEIKIFKQKPREFAARKLMYTHVHNNIIHNNPKVEQPICPVQEMLKEVVS